MSKFKKCDSCGITVTKIKRSKFDSIKNWDAMKWHKPDDLGVSNGLIGYLNGGCEIRTHTPVFILCKTCIECYNLLNLEIDFDKKEWIVPFEIDKLIETKTNSSRMIIS